MTPAAAPKSKIPAAALIIGGVTVLLLVWLLAYLNRPGPVKTAATSPSQEAKAYVSQLELSDVTMNASESFMNQQLVEVQGKITNHGSRALKTVEVFCIFYNPAGQEIHRERSTIVQSKNEPLGPNQTRAFRLPFDALPEAWNQAVPRMVIAGITFAS